MEVPLSELETICKSLVEKEFGTELWAEYVSARCKIFTDLLTHIYGAEPHLSDHSADHIIDVFVRAFALLGEEKCMGDKSETSLEPAELYFLILAILFHDVGNVFSRKRHKSRLSEAYEFARGSGQQFMQERRLLFRIVEAHGGETSAGSPDTIEPLEAYGIFRGKRVDCKRIAAILRFADELAEGRQRTSIFMQRYLPYPAESQVYHDYASITDIHIDRRGGRIVVVYNIDIAPIAWGKTMDPARLQQLLEFCYHRLEKMDLERKYNRHYCSLLNVYKRTEATFNFSCQDHELDFELPKIALDDLVLPNNFAIGRIPDGFPAYKLDTLMQKLTALVPDMLTTDPQTLA